jgi:hypothetical protein
MGKVASRQDGRRKTTTPAPKKIKAAPKYKMGKKMDWIPGWAPPTE